MFQELPKIIKKNLTKLQAWLDELEDYVELKNTTEALFILRAVLHQLRDSLPLAHVAHLNAQLPLIVSGLFFEGWSGHEQPYKLRNEAAFLEALEENLALHTTVTPEVAVVAVFSLLKSKIAAKEIEKVQKVLPKQISTYFDKLLIKPTEGPIKVV